MPKISALVENENPSPEAVTLFAPASGALELKTPISNLRGFPDRTRMAAQQNDMLGVLVTGIAPLYPFAHSLIGAGSIAAEADSANHPGILRISANGINTGANIYLGTTSCIVIGGSEVGEFIFMLPTITNTVVRMGFLDSLTAGAVVDGCYISINAGSLAGVNFAASVSSSTASTYTVSVSTWYRAKVEVNSAATLVTFSLYSEAGTLLWSDTLATNIPTAATGFVAQGRKTTAGAADVLDMDWMSYSNSKVLTR